MLRRASLVIYVRTLYVRTYVRTSVETYVGDEGGLPNGTNKDAEGQDAGSHAFKAFEVGYVLSGVGACLTAYVRTYYKRT